MLFVVANQLEQLADVHRPAGARGDLDGQVGAVTFHVVVDRESNDFGDGDGEPYLDIAIICDANNVEELRVPDLVGYLMTLRDKLVESGVEEFPVPSFFLKSEWEGLTKSSGSR